MEIFLLTIIFIMSVYIAILHVKLMKRDLRIDSLIRQLNQSGFAGKFTDFIEDKIFDTNVLNFILEYEKEAKIYLHYTKFRENAENILREGFKFAESFYKTAFSVTSDRLDLIIKHNSKKYYGNYIIIICISERIIKYYNSKIIMLGLKNCHYENILTEKPPEKNENAEIIYTLPSKYIKGIINYHTGEIIKNPEFDHNYLSPWFEINIEKMKTSQG